MAEYLVRDSSLSAVADAIREKAGTTGEMEFPQVFVSAISTIATGGGNGGPYTNVDLLRTVEVTEDVSAIQIDWMEEWAEYDNFIIRPNTIYFSVDDWLYVDVNSTGKNIYAEKRISYDEAYSFGLNYYNGYIFRQLLKNWYVPSVKFDSIQFVYLQPYVSTTVFKAGSKIDVLGVKFR